MNIDTRVLTAPESGLASQAARLLGKAMALAHAGSNPADAADTERMHEEQRLYPRLIVSMPHGGGAVRLEMLLCSSETDQPVVRMLAIEAVAEDAAWAH